MDRTLMMTHKDRVVLFSFCLLVFAFSGICVRSSHADILEFYATGLEGDGLLGGNVFGGSTNPGSGGIGPTGITVDTDLNILHIDVEWGSENGYTDMSGPVTLLHLHGPTASSAPDSFSQVTTDIIIVLQNSLRFRDSASSGGLVDNFFISNEEISWMRQGRTYINVHTELNPSGETRGYLLETVPEPTSGGVIVLTGLCYGLLRRRNRS